MTVTLDALARPSGRFAMVAMDQRESLRTMLREHGHDASDGRYTRFKETVARELGPLASGFLIEPDQVETVAPFVPHGLILAVDGLVQEVGGPVEDTFLDEPPSSHPQAVALKLLVIWRDDERRAERVELSRRFVELAAERGLLSVLEPVVRVPERRRARTRSSRPRASSARCGRRSTSARCRSPVEGDPAEITRRAARDRRRAAGSVGGLSQGVEPDDFPGAVGPPAAAARSGMLAGRALWTRGASPRTIPRSSCARVRAAAAGARPHRRRARSALAGEGVRIRGVIEGFYGPPWSHAERLDLIAFCGVRRPEHVGACAEGRPVPPRALARSVPRRGGRAARRARRRRARARRRVRLRGRTWPVESTTRATTTETLVAKCRQVRGLGADRSSCSGTTSSTTCRSRATSIATATRRGRRAPLRPT